MPKEKRPKRDDYTRSFKPKKNTEQKEAILLPKKNEGLLTQASALTI